MTSIYIAKNIKQAESYINRFKSRVERLYGKADFIDVPNLNVKYPIVLCAISVTSTYRYDSSTTLMFIRRPLSKSLISNFNRAIYD